MTFEARYVVAVGALACLGACGGGGTSAQTSPSGGDSAPSGATITIGANGVLSTPEVTINVGQSVTFVNNHNRTHDVTSDPHPIHTDCPVTNTVGRIAAGQTKSSGTFTTARTCRFHDHDDPDNASLKGRIVVR